MSNNEINKESTVVFTDLDGTLLDRKSYSCEGAEEALRLIQEKNIPLIFCSAKTRTEQEFYIHKLRIKHPFIVENGGAVYIRKDYFKFKYDFQRSDSEYNVIEIGLPYEKIIENLIDIRSKCGINFTGFRDMTAEEVSAETGLDLAAAKRAMKREYDETLKFEDSEEQLEKFEKALQQKGLRLSHGGTFYHVTGANDKGEAANILIQLYRKAFNSIRTIGIGDSENDIPLLSAVDIPVLLQKPEGFWEEMNLPGLRRIEGGGSAAWNRIILELLRF